MAHEGVGMSDQTIVGFLATWGVILLLVQIVAPFFLPEVVQ